MKKFLTVGVFDLMHYGHIMLFKRAKELVNNLADGGGGILIVAVQSSETVLKYKPEAQLVYDTNERRFMVGSIRWVDEVVTYTDVDVDIKNIDFDVFIKGPDQNHSGFQRAVEWCKENGKEVVTLPRTEGVSSTSLKQQIKLM